jgi:nitroreductase
MNMYETIFSRRSIHHFKKEKVEWEVIENILKFADNLSMLINGISVEFKLVSNIEKKQGFCGPMAVKAPYYICLSSEKKTDYLINAGYMMQQLNLYIASKGLATCFMNLASPGHGLKATMKYEYVCALAFGTTAKQLYRNSQNAKRLPEKETVVYKEEVSQNIRQIITAARLSPSACNTQPWRFVVYKNRIHIFTRKNLLPAKKFMSYNLIDIGIMMANLLVAAEELWVDYSITKSYSLINKPLQNNAYVYSIIIDDINS